MRPLPEFDAAGRRMGGYTIEFRTRGRTRTVYVWASGTADAIAQARQRYHYGRDFRSLTSDPPSV